MKTPNNKTNPENKSENTNPNFKSERRGIENPTGNRKENELVGAKGKPAAVNETENRSTNPTTSQGRQEDPNKRNSNTNFEKGSFTQTGEDVEEQDEEINKPSSREGNR